MTRQSKAKKGRALSLQPKTKAVTGVDLKRLVRLPSDAALRKAFLADLEQHFIDSLTPDRGYAVPIDNIKALLLRGEPNAAVRANKELNT